MFNERPSFSICYFSVPYIVECDCFLMFVYYVDDP